MLSTAGKPERRYGAAAKGVAMSLLVAVLLTVGLSATDLTKLQNYEAAGSEPNPPKALVEQARAEFRGRGTDLAAYFLKHTDPRPRSDAYFFVLRTVGDAETALVLIRALPNPPAHESGMLDRHFGEVEAAIQAVLENGAARNDPRIVPALEHAVDAARSRRNGVGMPAALAAVGLIGRCGSADGARALRKLAADSDPAIRATAAEALGDLAAAPDAQSSEEGPPVRTLLRVLESDPNAEARRQAAESLGRFGTPESILGLRSALSTENDPRVVDAILQSLQRSGAPIQDPEQCRELIARTWDVYFARQMLNCWGAKAGREEILAAALAGPAVQRAAALDWVVAVEKPVPVVKPFPNVPEPEPVRFDPALQEKLLGSAVDVLSQGKQISEATRDSTEKALWRISGGDMPLALRYADRVRPRQARFRMSAALARADTGAYDAYRRRRQFRRGMLLALGIGVFLFFGSVRHAVALMAASAVGWAFWGLQASGVRELPPPPLALLSVAAIAFFSAGLVMAAAVLMRRRKPGASRARTVLSAVEAVGAAGVLAFVVCGLTRATRLFPIGMEGWELFFDPAESFLLAVCVAAALATADGLLRWAHARRRAAMAP
jgi:HEAT repeats